MNPTELVIEIARRTKTRRYQLSRPQVEEAINAFVEILQEELSRPDGRLSIPNVGVLEIERRQRKNTGRIRIGNSSEERSPSTTTSYHYKFKPSRELQKRLRESGQNEA
jgi:nucleoid DNA-binding protein